MALAWVEIDRDWERETKTKEYELQGIDDSVMFEGFDPVLSNDFTITSDIGINDRATTVGGVLARAYVDGQIYSGYAYFEFIVDAGDAANVAVGMDGGPLYGGDGVPTYMAGDVIGVVVAPALNYGRLVRFFFP